MMILFGIVCLTNFCLGIAMIYLGLQNFDDLERLVENKNRVSDQRIRVMASDITDIAYIRIAKQQNGTRAMEDEIYNKLKEKLQ